MNQEVPNLYDNLNLFTLPKIIKDEFFKMTPKQKKTTLHKPFDAKYDIKEENLKFYTHSDETEYIEYQIANKILLNESYELLTYKDFFNNYIKEYGRGFYKGYTKYSDELNTKDKIFEPDNIQMAHKIFSRVIDKSRFTVKIGFPITLIPFDNKEEITKKFDREIDYYLNKEAFYNSGIKGGEFYKAWTTILHYPTLFEGIFNRHLKSDEKKEEPITETPNLTLKNIPNFNLQQRYKIFTQLGYDKAIHTLDTSKSSKTKILALIMGISVDNAKHLINGTYKELKPDDIEEFDEYLERVKVKL